METFTLKEEKIINKGEQPQNIGDCIVNNNKQVQNKTGLSYPPGETWHRLIVDPWDGEDFHAQVEEFKAQLDPDFVRQYLSG